MAERNREVALLPYNCMGVVRSMMSSIDNIIISQGGKVTHDIFAKGVAERKWVFEFGPCTTCSLLLRAFMVHARLTRLALWVFFSSLLGKVLGVETRRQAPVLSFKATARNVLRRCAHLLYLADPYHRRS